MRPAFPQNLWGLSPLEPVGTVPIEPVGPGPTYSSIIRGQSLYEDSPLFQIPNSPPWGQSPLSVLFTIATNANFQYLRFVNILVNCHL